MAASVGPGAPPTSVIVAASAASTETYADADGLVQWAEMIALPADYLLLAGLPHG